MNEGRLKILRHDLREAVTSMDAAHVELLDEHSEQYETLEPHLNRFRYLLNEVNKLRKGVLEKPVNLDAFLKDKIRTARNDEEVQRKRPDWIAEYMAHAASPRPALSERNLRLVQGQMFDHAEEMKHLVQLMREQATAKNSAVHDILDGFHQGAQKIQNVILASDAGGKRNFDFRDLTNGLKTTVRNAADGKKVPLALDVPHEPLRFFGEMHLLIQMAENLVRNSITHHSGERDLHVNVQIKNEKGKLRFIVEDTGSGIHPDELLRINQFKGYSSRATPEDIGEHGSGLTIAKLACEVHGGSLKASSKGINKGARFEAIFPNGKRESL